MKDYDAILDADCKLYNNVTIGESPESMALTNTIWNYVLARAFKNVCVSLSGGVDSMVMLHILKRLETEGVVEKITAVHIEYINRDEAVLETAMLLEWCGMESIPLAVRKIDYMSRDEVSREFYEEQTRKARFGAYRYMMREHGMQGFCLGHHYGDLGENVLMNLFVGRDILDLFVMEEDSEIDGVRLLRPMLKHPKVDIFQYARDHKIPYFIDTTPDWCCRGVLRRKIMPILEDQYSGIHGTLARIGERSREWNQMIETMIIQPFLKKVVREKDRMSFEVDAILLEQPRVFWFRIFLEIFHSVGRKMISGKNMDSLLSLFRRRLDSKEKFGLQFSNGLTGEFKHNRIVIMM
jgi:tRNA(Ile)-lysidine synthase